MNFDFSSFDVVSIVWFCIGLFAIYNGTKKYKNRDKYKQKNGPKLAKSFGILMIVLGILLVIGAVLRFFKLPGIFNLINVVLMIATGIAMLIVYKKLPDGR